MVVNIGGSGVRAEERGSGGSRSGTDTAWCEEGQQEAGLHWLPKTFQEQDGEA